MTICSNMICLTGKIPRSLSLMRGIAGNDFFWRKLVVAVPVIDESSAISGDAVEMQVRIGFETLRLLIISGRVRITSGQPTPRSIQLIGLAPVDDNRRCCPAQGFHDSAPSLPLRITATARQIQPGIVERITGDSGAFLEGDQIANQKVLKIPRCQ